MDLRALHSSLLYWLIQGLMVLALLVLMLLAAPAMAQQAPLAPPAADPQATIQGAASAPRPETAVDLEGTMKAKAAIGKPAAKASDVGTLFFTLWQHTLLQDAKRLYRTRPPSAAEMASADDPLGALNDIRPRGLREISLSGILYRGQNDWVVWMNGQRLTPDALPKEVIDIKVRNGQYVDLKWFDAYTNLIFPVRLRAHERFNLDSRIFLPGLSTETAATAAN